MPTINPSSPVGSLVAEQAGRARVFEWFGIDYCCGGKQPLDQACAEKKLQLSQVIAELAKADVEPKANDDRNWEQLSTAALIEHIVTTHHGYLRMELPRLTQLVNKVAGVHGERHPYLLELKPLYDGLRRDLEAHLNEEETEIFPAIRLVSSRGSFGMLASEAFGAIQRAETEHISVGDRLHRINQMTDGYVLPADGCETFRAMLHALMTLESDTHMHVHLENNILFPKALAASAA